MKTLLLALGLILSATLAPSKEPGSVARLDILPGYRDADGRHIAGLHIQMEPGWKTYWRVPGEGGIPPRFDWSRSRNLAGAAVSWPVPEVFYDYGLRSIGYSGGVVLPVVIQPDASGKHVDFRARIEIGVCKDVCVPVTLTAKANLPATGGQSDPRLTAAINSRPTAPRAAGVRRVDCRIEPIEDGLKLTATMTMPRRKGGEEAVIELADPAVWVSTPSVTRKNTHLIATSELVAPSGQPFSLDRSDIRITILSPGEAVDIRGCS